MSQITSHILDTTSGKPAADIQIILFKVSGEERTPLASGKTNTDGRLGNLLPIGNLLEPGNYGLHFATSAYFAEAGLNTFYPFVEINFIISDETHYHIPLLISPFGYTTYRGS